MTDGILNFSQLIDSLVYDTLDVSLPAFAPELAVCGTIVALLLLRIIRWLRWINASFIAFVGAAIALWCTAPWQYLEPATAGTLQPSELFTGMLVYDGLTVYFRSVLLIFALLFVVFTKLSGIPDQEDGPDFYCLILGATLGMMLMSASNHMLMVFLSVEMASVPSYALAGMLKGRKQSSEAALKYSIYGAGAAGVMLYGISLLAGVLGTVHLPTMATQLAAQLAAGMDPGREAVLALGGLMLAVGLAFKLSAVPFHFWCPDVFEGASAEVNAFLSVSSKAAALALLVRIAIGFSTEHPPIDPQTALKPPAVAVTREVADHAASGGSVRLLANSSAAVSRATTVAVEDEQHAANAEDAKVSPLRPARDYIVGLVSLFAAVTCTFGNLAAYGQTNIKRLLAYSTIAHAGYLMMPVAAAVRLLDSDVAGSDKAIAALAFYVGAYLLMNLGAFAVVAFIRNSLRTEEVADYAGLIRSAPWVAICFSMILLSLIGLPPLVGFAAKFNIFAALVDAKLWTLLIIGGLNTVLSLFYYLRVVKVMIFDPEPEDRVPVSLSPVAPEWIFVSVVSLPILVLGIWWDALSIWSRQAVSTLW